MKTTNKISAKIASAVIGVAGVMCSMAVAEAVAVAGHDKTLVSWVCLANTAQQGGSALTIQSGDRFDGIVFGERVVGKWMAGSEGFARTQGSQQDNAIEKADNTALVQMAIVYKGSQISIYRNGEPYASYEASNVDLLKTQNQAVFGLRHEGAGTGQTLRGSIEDARIYDKALSAEEIRKLETNKESGIKPYAWWTFEKGKETDRMGRFPVNTLDGGAKIEGGRLVLESNGATLIAAGKAGAHALSPDGLVTPVMPENPPANWQTYHLVHPGPGNAMPGDPNCAFYWKGRYHLHYIYNHGGFNFAHLSSKDLVHWKWHPTTLTPKFTGHGMFSGTGFITKDGKPAIIYHGQGSGRNQMAFALDDNLEKWTKPQAVMPEPINGKIPEMRHWDPDCWLNGDTYYAISGGGNPPLMKSKDLLKWDYIGDLLHKDMPTTIDAKKDEDISCGNMFKIGNKWMLLCINHGRGCRYYLGDFKDEKYLPDFHAMMSWNGNNFFAPESVLTKDGRRIMWAWIMNLPISPTGVQSLPRELELPKDGALRIRPLRELEDLRYGNKHEQGITVKADAAYALKEVNGDALELELTVKAPIAKEFGLDVLCDKDGKNGLRIAIAGERKLLKVGKVEAPFELKKDEDLVLRVFIDKNFVEVFANDRQAAVAAADKYVQEKTSVSLFSKGGDTVVTRVRSWKMKSIYPEGKEAVVHAGFFTPSRKGQIWDTWAYFHEGRYYLYYLAGNFNRWDGHELALSDDGVHWQEQGVRIKPREGVKWMGTGHIWKSPDFGQNHTWVLNYSEWFGDKQDIMFATSTNLLDWTKVDEKHRFVQDKRWYKEKGRWDCIDTVQRPDGSLYGYFTADPDPAKVTYRPCGFGFAESNDGITWTALPPIEGDISGEFGGIQKIGEKYYIIISEGRVAVGDRPAGPFYSQKKNPNVFGRGCDIYFPRFFHNAPGGPLVNHFYNNGTVFAAPLKAVDVGRDGILRLKWWKNNDGLKANPVKISLVPAGEGYFPSLKMLDWKPEPARTTVIEGTIVRAAAGTGDAVSPRVFFDQGGGKGQCLVFFKDEVAFGNINAAGGDFKPAQTSARGIEFGTEARFRLLIREDMLELYVNDYLMNLKRVSYNGRIGFMVDDRQGAFKDISVWQSK